LLKNRGNPNCSYVKSDIKTAQIAFNNQKNKK
jgi:hypothetical protein